MTKPVLGKGFEGLIPVGFSVSEVAEPGEQIRKVDIEQIFPNPDQPRKEFDQKSLEELAASISRHGIIQPIVITPNESGAYRIVAGERRYRAAKIAGIRKLPAIIRNHKELEELEIALVENVQRVDLSPLEQALSIVRLRDQFSLSPKEIAKKLGKAETTVSNIVRLLNLPKEAIEALQKNIISEGHARAILSLKNNPKKQKELLQLMIENGLSVREAEQYVKNNRSTNEQQNSSLDPVAAGKIEALNNRGFSIKVRTKKRGGTILLDYKSQDELNKIIDSLN